MKTKDEINDLICEYLSLAPYLNQAKSPALYARCNKLSFMLAANCTAEQYAEIREAVEYETIEKVARLIVGLSEQDGTDKVNATEIVYHDPRFAKKHKLHAV